MRSPSQVGGPDATSARVAAVSVASRPRGLNWLRTQTSRRLAFGYLLLTPATLYVLFLVGAPFLFSLYLALSDATVGEQVARFSGLENFKAALEMDTFWIAFRNSIVFFFMAAFFKSLLVTTLTL